MNATRQGGVLIRLLAMVTLVALAGALAWTALANHRASGQWSFHPLDTAWWSPKAANPEAGDPFAEVAHDAKRLAGQAGEALWGPGGLVERCETWWHANQDGHPAATAPGGNGQPPAVTPPAGAPGSAPTGAPVAAPTTTPTTVRGLLEQRFSASEQRFAEGIDLAKHARPTLGDDAKTLAGRLGTLQQAHTCFADVDRDLGEALPAYQAIAGHDAAKLARAEQLQGFARQMLELTRLTP